MRILSVTAQKPNSTGSGVYLTELVKALHAEGHTQAVLAGVCSEDDILLPEDIAVYPVYYESDEMPYPIAGMSDEMPYTSTRYSDMTETMLEQFSQTFSRRIAYAVADFAPDIILCHHLYLLTAIVREVCDGIPVYGICHGSDLRQIKKNEKKRDYIKKQIIKLDGIFALHSEQKEQICQFFACAPEKVHIIGTGYNSDIFYINPEITRTETPLSLLFAGKISEKKGVKSLLKALCHLNFPVRLSFAGGYGNKTEYDSILALAQQTREATSHQIQFLGKLNQQDLACMMNQNQIFVLPSFYEGLPLVLVEALACGMRSVCTDLPGIRPWMEENLPNNQIVYVTPPQMQNEDEPLAAELEPFEQRLADAIKKAFYAAPEEPAHIQKLSWNGLAKELIHTILQ